MSKEKITIWNRDFDMEVKYDCYSGEEVLQIQKDAINEFLKSGTAIDAALEQVKQYCLKNNKDDIGGNSIENIFKYVAPKYLYVARNKDKHVVAIMCNYKFDPENGLAVVFENEKFSKIGMQDIIL
ncbi:MAG: hypothetical protein K6A90_07020 [Lachnospiraceae bacterium]|nr:hypothetical protein [Lachnospiraceae bacterium]